jgi:hypothetical protein
VAAFVAIISVTVPLPVTEPGVKLQVASDGNPAHEEAPNWTAPGKPSTGVTVKTKSIAEPRATVAVLVLMVRLKSATADEVDAM